jgi:hypothetical protein
MIRSYFTVLGAYGLNKLEVVLEELKNKVEYERLSEDKNLQNIECQEQSIAIIENKRTRKFS